MNPNPTTTTTAALRGRCLCGLVTYTSTALPRAISLCHCVACRKFSGAPFLAWGDFENTSLRWNSGTQTGPGPEPGSSSNGSDSPHIRLIPSAIAVRGCCGTCGSPLFMKYHCHADTTSVAMGTVDDESLVVAVDDVDDVVVGENEKKNQKKKKMQVVRPKEHIFLREKASWFEILGTGEKEEDGVARYEGFDDSFLRDLREWEDGGRRRRADLGGV